MIDEFAPISLLTFLRKKWLHVIAPLGFSLISFLLSFVVNYLMTKMLIPEIYGKASLALAWLTILGSVVILGVDQTSLRFIAKYIDHNEAHHIHAFIRWSIAFMRKPFIFCFILSTVAILAPLLTSEYFFNREWSFFLAKLCLATPILGISNWLASVLLAYRKTSHATFIQYLAFQLTLAVILSICVSSNIPLMYDNLIYEIILISLIILLCLSMRLCNQLIPKFEHMIRSASRISQSTASEWKQCALRQAKSMLIYNLLINLDFLLMGFYGKDTANVGFYNIAIAISDIIWLVPQSLFQYLKSEVEISLKSSRRTQILQKHWDQTFIINALLTMGLFLIIHAQSDSILSLFGEEYGAAKPFLLILLVGNSITALLGCPSIALRYTGHVNKLFVINIAAVITMTLLVFILVPHFGLIGIAYACAITSILQCMVENIVVQSFTQIKPLKWM